MKVATLAILVCCIASSMAHSQTFPYEFSVFNDPYFELTAPGSISNADVWDDPFYITSTGFEVTLFDVVTNTLGIISPGSQVININEANPDTVQVLMPYMADIMNASDTIAVSPISYQLEGPPGNQVFKLEWKNVGFYGEWNATNSYYNTTNFQLWLYQNSGVIEFRYGPNTIKSGSLLHFFGTGPLVLLGQNVAFDGSGWEGLWALGGNPQNPTISAIPSGQQPLPGQSLSGEPESGTVYRFAPVVIGTQEALPIPQLTVWPTPANRELNLTTVRGERYSVYNMQGQIMWSQTAADNLLKVDISTWPAGSYCVKSDDGQSTRFVKL